MEEQSLSLERVVCGAIIVVGRESDHRLRKGGIASKDKRKGSDLQRDFIGEVIVVCRTTVMVGGGTDHGSERGDLRRRRKMRGDWRKRDARRRREGLRTIARI